MALDVRPLGGEHAVHHRVAHRAVAARGMVAPNALPLRAERFDRLLRSEVEVVGAKAHDLAAEMVESVREEEQLADRVDVTLLPALRVPGVADLDAARLFDD